MELTFYEIHLIAFLLSLVLSLVYCVLIIKNDTETTRSKGSKREKFSSPCAFDLGKQYPRNVTYVKSDKFSANERALIDHWMDYMSVVTCLTFIPASRPPKKRIRAYLSFVLSKKEYSSTLIGRLPCKGIFEHRIHLTHDILTRNAMMLHEVMHAIGFAHEHSRPDRDEYIELQWPMSWKPERRILVNYGRYREVRGQSLPYDYYSIMHYCPNDFYYYGRVSRFSVRQKGIDQALIGQSFGLTELDVRKMNTVYECPNWLDKQLKQGTVRKLPLRNTGAFIIWPNKFDNPVNF